ncbi:MAG: hypothetical protein OHK0021_02030 [Bryobacter sp.]
MDRGATTGSGTDDNDIKLVLATRVLWHVPLNSITSERWLGDKLLSYWLPL